MKIMLLIFQLISVIRMLKVLFFKHLKKSKKECDGNGYLKALFNKDEYALVIEEIVNYNFDEIEFKKFTTNLVEQLSFDFENEK